MGMNLIQMVRSAEKELLWFKEKNASIINKEYGIKIPIDAILHSRWAVETEEDINSPLGQAFTKLMKHLKPGEIIDQTGNKSRKQ